MLPFLRSNIILWTFFTTSQITYRVKASSSSQSCINNPEGPLLPLRRHQASLAAGLCPPLVDDETAILTGSWAPWSIPPTCFGPKKGGKGSKLCVYTATRHWAGGPVSVITTPQVAANLASYILDPGVPWLERDRGVPFGGEVRAAAAAAAAGSSESFEVREIPGKGFGVVATRFIPKNTILMGEMPVMLSIMEDVEAWESRDFMKLLHRAANQLPRREQDEVMGLARQNKGYIVYDILNTNTFQVAVDRVAHSGLYPGIARINHACKPNSFTRYSPSTLIMEVVSYRDIQPGEELSISYAPLNILSKDRRSLLQLWGFNCTCSLCADPAASKKSDARRSRIQQILEDLDKPQTRTVPERIAADIKEVESLTEREGMTAQTGDLYGIIAEMFLEIGEVDMAKRYAVVAVRNLRHYAGFDSERARSAMEFLGRLDQGEMGRERGEVGDDHDSKEGNGSSRSAAWSDLSLFEVDT